MYRDGHYGTDDEADSLLLKYVMEQRVMGVLAVERGKINWQFVIVQQVIAQFLSTGELVRNPNGKAIINALFTIYCELCE